MGQSASNRRRRAYHHHPPPPSSFAAAPPPYYTPYAPAYYTPSPSTATVQHLPQLLPPPPPPLVELQQTKTVKNGVNVDKDTIRLEPDEQSPDQHLVSFTFDALTDGSFTIYYFAKEGSNSSIHPAYPDMYIPTKLPFQKGSGQKFRQPSGSGIDFGFFELDDLAKSLNGDIFPLVIYAEAYPASQLVNPSKTATDAQITEAYPAAQTVNPSKTAPNAQITEAVIGKHPDGSFEVKVVKQILWYDGQRYELEKIFGLSSSRKPETGGAGGGDVDVAAGKECVICLTEPSDTAVLPCRHLCMCSGCAKELRLQFSNCPICRHPVEKLMEIMVTNG